MMESVLVPLDGSRSSEAATALSIRLAERYGVTVFGLGVLDVPTITAPEASGAFGAGFKEEKDKALLADARGRVKEFLQRFDTRCTEAGIEHACVHAEGVPPHQIEKASVQHDLIVIGKDSNFFFATSDRVGDTVKRLLRDNPRPVMVVPNELPAKVENIMVAYDGSLQSARAIHMFVLLGLAKDRQIELVSVQEDEALAKELCAQAQRFLIARGLEVQSHPIVTSAKPREILLTQVQTLGVRGVVMGAFGKSGLREMFLGTSTQTMIARCPVPLFVHH